MKKDVFLFLSSLSIFSYSEIVSCLMHSNCDDIENKREILFPEDIKIVIIILKTTTKKNTVLQNQRPAGL